jgi:hypothetical protein
MPPERQALTPPAVAKRYGIGPSKVLGWIRRRELRAVNVASEGKRPRWVVLVADLEAFERRRSNVATPAPARRRRRVVEEKKPDGWVDFFPRAGSRNGRVQEDS